MDFFSSMEISSSALSAERVRMNLISSNLANANSTRTPEGGPYKRKDTVFSAVPMTESFRSVLGRMGQDDLKKVQVSQIREDANPPRMQYDPTHPDADAQGYVAFPNINIIEEMADMMTSSRAYEANVNAVQTAKSMAMKALELGR